MKPRVLKTEAADDGLERELDRDGADAAGI
jgi:hypothetical protein